MNNSSSRLLSVESDCARRSIWKLQFCCVLCWLQWHWRKMVTGIGKTCQIFKFSLINFFMELIFAAQRQKQQGELKKLCKHVMLTIIFQHSGYIHDWVIISDDWRYNFCIYKPNFASNSCVRLDGTRQRLGCEDFEFNAVLNKCLLLKKITYVFGDRLPKYCVENTESLIQLQDSLEKRCSVEKIRHLNNSETDDEYLQIMSPR